MAKVKDRVIVAQTSDPVVTVRITKLGDGKVSNGRHHPVLGDEYYEWKETALLPRSVAEALEARGYGEIEGDAPVGSLPDGVDRKGHPIVAAAELTGPAYLQTVAAVQAKLAAEAAAAAVAPVSEPIELVPEDEVVEVATLPEPAPDVPPAFAAFDADGDGQPGGSLPKARRGRPPKAAAA